jgi:hypothetical protein
MRAIKFDFVINLKTAKALGLCIAAGVFAIANVPSAIPLPAPFAAALYGASGLVLWPAPERAGAADRVCSSG